MNTPHAPCTRHLDELPCQKSKHFGRSEKKTIFENLRNVATVAHPRNSGNSDKNSPNALSSSMWDAFCRGWYDTHLCLWDVRCTRRLFFNLFPPASLHVHLLANTCPLLRILLRTLPNPESAGGDIGLLRTLGPGDRGT